MTLFVYPSDPFNLVITLQYILGTTVLKDLPSSFGILISTKQVSTFIPFIYFCTLHSAGINKILHMQKMHLLIFLLGPHTTDKLMNIVVVFLLKQFLKIQELTPPPFSNNF